MPILPESAPGKTHFIAEGEAIATQPWHSVDQDASLTRDRQHAGKAPILGTHLEGSRCCIVSSNCWPAQHFPGCRWRWRHGLGWALFNAGHPFWLENSLRALRPEWVLGQPEHRFMRQSPAIQCLLTADVDHDGRDDVIINTRSNRQEASSDSIACSS